MRSILFILMLVPVLSFGQSDEQKAMLEKKSDGNFKLGNANKTFKQPAVRKDADSKKKLKEDIVYMGNVTFTIGDNRVACDSAISYENEGTIALYKVNVTNPQSFVISGTKMLYNKEANQGSLTSDIKVTAMNGNVVGTSESLLFDFSYNIYRIINGSITPLPPKEPSH